MLLLAALLFPMIHTDFEGGSLGKVERLSETHLRLAVKGESDQNGRNRQANWYYFRVDQAPSKDMVFDIVNLPGEYNYKPNRGAVTQDTPPVISYDGVSWTHVQTYAYDPKEPKLVLHIRPLHSRFWIAHCPPYTNATLAKLRNEVQSNPDFHEETVGKTVGDSEIPLWTLTHSSGKGKPTIWLFFRQHSWESGSSWAGEGAIRTLLANNPDSKKLLDQVIWKIYPMCDPDGVARGGVRFNVNGFDLNRNWDVVDPVKMPEITAERNAIGKWLREGNRIDLLLSLHNTETNEYLEGPPNGGPDGKLKVLAERLFQILRGQTTFDPSRPLSFAEDTTTPGMTGRMTVAQGLYRDFGICTFIMEQRISNNPKLGRLPEVADRLKFGGELVKSLRDALLQDSGANLSQD
jgi:hypothetical protein